MAAIVSGELIFRYSVVTGAAGNTVAGTPGGSLGKYISTTAWAGSVINDLFDDVSGAENAANTVVDYRCIFVYNSNALNALQNAAVWMSEVAGGVNVAIAVDTTAASLVGASSAQALQATTESAPGASVVALAYSSPTTQGTGLALGSIPAASCRAVWLRRTSTNSSALSNDGVTLNVGGDTGAL